MVETLHLPVAGRTYEVPSPPAKIGLALQASWVVSQARRRKIDPPAYAVERLALYDDPNRSMDEDSLGPAWAQMVDDDVPLADLRAAAQAAYLWIVTGSESLALKVLDPTANLDDGAGGEGEDPKVSTSTGEASTTPPQGSTSSTTSPRTTSAASPD